MLADTNCKCEQLSNHMIYTSIFIELTKYITVLTQALQEVRKPVVAHIPEWILSL